MRIQSARNRLALYVAAALLAAAVTFVPTPYSLMLPGRAVDLRSVVTVDGKRSLGPAFYLTDVRFAAGSRPQQLLAAFIPGVGMVRTQRFRSERHDGRRVRRSRARGHEREPIHCGVRGGACRGSARAGSALARHARIFCEILESKERCCVRWTCSFRSTAIPSRRRSTWSRRSPRRKARLAGSHCADAAWESNGSCAVPTMAYGTRTGLGAYLTTMYERPEIPVAVHFICRVLKGVGRIDVRTRNLQDAAAGSSYLRSGASREPER